MNGWVQRGLRTALLTGGFLAVGAGVAAADENDLTAGVLGVTATVPVADPATVQTPVVTGSGGDTTVGNGTGGGIALPVDTDTAPGTTALGSAGTGGVSAPVRVVEATDTPPDPQDGLTVTVPVNTSGGGTAGTTITVPVVTGDVGEVLDGDPATGTEVDVDLDGPLVLGTDGSGLLLDVEDTVTIGGGGRTAPVTVVEVPAGLEDDRPTTLALPLGTGTGTSEPVSGNEVDVHLGGPIGDGRAPASDDPTEQTEPALSLPVGTGDLLSDLLGGGAVTGNTVDVHLGGGAGSGTGTVVTVPVNEGGSGTGSSNLVRLTIPIDLVGEASGEGPGEGPGEGTGEGSGSGTGTGGSGGGDGQGTVGVGVGSGDGTGTGTSAATDCGAGHGAEAAGTAGAGPADGTATTAGQGTGPAGGGHASGTGGDACGVGDPGALATQSSSDEHVGTAAVGLTGLFVLGATLLAALARARLRWKDRSLR